MSKTSGNFYIFNRLLDISYFSYWYMFNECSEYMKIKQNTCFSVVFLKKQKNKTTISIPSTFMDLNVIIF